MTHAVNEIIEADDPELLPDYQKDAGKSIGQTHTYVDHGYTQTMDDIYGSTAFESMMIRNCLELTIFLTIMVMELLTLTTRFLMDILAVLRIHTVLH